MLREAASPIQSGYYSLHHDTCLASAAGQMSHHKRLGKRWPIQNKKPNFITIGSVASYRNVMDILSSVLKEINVWVFFLFMAFSIQKQCQTFTDRNCCLQLTFFFFFLPLPHFFLKDLFFLCNFYRILLTINWFISDFTFFMFHDFHPCITMLNISWYLTTASVIRFNSEFPPCKDISSKAEMQFIKQPIFLDPSWRTLMT